MSDLTPNTSSSVRPFASEEPAVTVPVFRPPVSPEDQTLFFPNAEGTPPAEPPIRIPHLGHAALFLASPASSFCSSNSYFWASVMPLPSQARPQTACPRNSWSAPRRSATSPPWPPL